MKTIKAASHYYFTFLITFILVFGLCSWDLIAKEASSTTANVKIGKGVFWFEDWQGHKLKVWSYAPYKYQSDFPVVFVMHGTKRDGKRYRNEWIRLAKAYGFLLIVPEFPKSNFKGSRRYNLGNVQDRDGNLNPKEVWTFSAIEPLFDEVKRRYANLSDKYGMYGHSAGAQFVHRFNYFIPEARLNKAVSANAGWYTLPSFDTDYPYGVKDIGISAEQLVNALSKDVIVLLGTAGTNTKSKGLRKTKEAMQQGPNRFERGKYYYLYSKKLAEMNKLPFNWQIKYTPDVGHKNSLMSAFAAPLLVK